MRRPLVAGPDGDRRDARVLELLHHVEELVPRRRRRFDAGLGEEVLVVPEPDHAEVERDAVLLAVDVVEPDRARVEVADEPRRLLGDVLHEAGVDLLAQTAAAPRLEQVGDVTGLEVGLKRGLERLVLEDVDLDRHVRVHGHELVGHRLPVRQARIVVLDVPPADRDRLGVAGAVVGAVASERWCQPSCRRRSTRCRRMRSRRLRCRRRRTRHRQVRGRSRARSPATVGGDVSWSRSASPFGC